MEKNIKTEVTIIGAGLVGMTAACALAKAGMKVVVIEAADIKKIREKESDGRTCAISYGSSKIFEEIGIWKQMAANAEPILDIRVTDGESPLFVHYDHKMVGDDPMGHIIENYHTREVLFEETSKYKNLTIIDNVRYSNIEYNFDNAVVTLQDGTKITSQLLIAADGRGSNLRKLAGIKATEWDYKQSGIVCTVKHEKNHEGVAVEKFLPAGPFAILPMKGGHHSSLVWTEPSDLAPLYMQMSDAEFMEQLEGRFAGYLGKIEVVSNRFSYPLNLVLARKYTAPRLALIGDAAHGMHPIAGQGFNLGIRDVPVLTRLIVDAKNIGQDIGSDSVLNEYAKIRKFDNISLLAITDLLTRLFSNNIFPINHARRIGLATVNKISPLKKFFIKHAMGEV